MKTASSYIRQHGFKSVQELADFIGLNRTTLLNWWDNDKKKKSFKIMVSGAVLWRDAKEKSEG
jgi:DNA-binding XRE family transcriptional regulator